MKFYNLTKEEFIDLKVMCQYSNFWHALQKDSNDYLFWQRVKKQREFDENAFRNEMSQQHWCEVSTALRLGYSVPEHVLAGYPEFQEVLECTE